MKKQIFPVLCMVLGFTYIQCHAQDAGPNTVFWKVTGDNPEKPSYLFGTMHIIPKKNFVSYDEADEILKSSDCLILEMLIDIPLQEKQELAKQMILPEGQSIPDIISEQDFSRIKSYAQDSLKIKDFLFNLYIKMKPFAFYSALIPHAIGEKIEGYDLHFSKIAKNKEIPVYGLEEFEFQMAIFDSIPYKKQFEIFFGEVPDLKAEMDEMLGLYFSHNIYKMAEITSEENDQYAEFENTLLTLRNQKWSESLDTLMVDNSCFIAVGAAHLAGENGLIKLLREKAYTVDPICLSEECLKYLKSQ